MSNSMQIREEEKILAPSLLAANPLKIAEEVHSLDTCAKWLHLDVMDGHFVPNMNGQVALVKSLKENFPHILDVHLMVSNPDDVIDLYIDAGANVVTVHQEVLWHHVRTLQYIRQRGALAGISLNPGTSLETIRELLPYLDLVLIMSVNPGFGGQKFIEATYDRVKRLRKMIDDSPYSILIEVDGGVSASNSQGLFDSGVDVAVAGSAIFNQDDRKAACRSILGE